MAEIIEWSPEKEIEKGLVCRRQEGIPMYVARFAKMPLRWKGTPAFMMKCLPPGTLILTSNWLQIPIEKLAKSPRNLLGYVFSNSSFEQNEILKVWEEKVTELLKIKLVTNHIIKASPDHPFFTLNGIKPASKLKKGELVPIVENKMNYIAGLVEGDGWISKNRDRVGISSTNLNLLKYVQGIITLFGYKSSLYLKKNKKSYKRYGTKPCYCLEIHGGFKEFLQNLFKNDFSSWIGGFFDAEGCVCTNPKNPFIQLTNSNLNLLENLKLILKEFGIHSRIRKDSRREVWYLIINRARDIIKFKNTINFRHEEKKKKLEKVCYEIIANKEKALDARILLELEDGKEKTSSELRKRIKGTKENIRRNILKLLKDGAIEVKKGKLNEYIVKSRFPKTIDLKWVPIKQVKIIKRKTIVFDFTTTTGNFIANNILVHNCWGGKGPEITTYFYNVPEEEIKDINENVGDWHRRLERFGTEEQKKYDKMFGIYIKGYKLPKIVGD